MVWSRAPLRIGLAGGGTDVDPYASKHGGAVLNATISLYAVTTISRSDRYVVRYFSEGDVVEEVYNDIDEMNGVVKAILMRISRDFSIDIPPIRIETTVDVPPGSGLGSSSTTIVSIVGGLLKFFGIELSRYEIARLAYEIERIDLRQKGGRQDQYAAVFGGFNLMEFSGDQARITPIRVPPEIRRELELSLVLYYTGRSRDSTKIIEDQQRSAEDVVSIYDRMKEQAYQMLDSLLRGNLMEVGRMLDEGWNLKKKLSTKVSNRFLEAIYRVAKESGAVGGKISGAGGGGFFVFFVPLDKRFSLISALEKLGGRVFRYKFEDDGLVTGGIR